MFTMCRLYGASLDQTKILMSLARETKAKGWWHAYNDAIPAHLELYVGLESSAERLREYEPELIPGLLQTDAYATEVFRARVGRLTDDEVRRAVALRKERRNILLRTWPAATRLEVVINEGALRRPLRTQADTTERKHSGGARRVTVRVS